MTGLLKVSVGCTFRSRHLLILISVYEPFTSSSVRNSSMTRFQVGQPGNFSSIFDACKIFFFLSCNAPRLAVGPILLHIRWVSDELAPKVKRPGRVAEHFPPRAKFKNEWDYTSAFPYVFLACTTSPRPRPVQLRHDPDLYNFAMTQNAFFRTF